MKKENLKNIRIKDIAIMAGVSEGTIDRVLHNRGEVSEKTRLKVEHVLNEIEYSPNLLARSLASKKKFLFTCIIPEHKPNDYWQSVEDGFNLAARDFSQYNVQLKKYYYDQYDANSFTILSEKIINDQPDALIIAPIFKEETIKLIQLPGFKHIPFSFIDSMLEELDFLTYYGQDSFQSGYVAARLMTQSIPQNAEVLIIRNKRKGAVSNQTFVRKKGFIQYLIDFKLSNIKLIDIELHENDDDANYKVLQKVFQKYDNIQGAITFNSKVYRLAGYFEELHYNHIQLIGYDLLEENIGYLKKGVVSFLLAQRPEKQAYFTIRDVCMRLVMKQEVKKNNYMPVDIIIKENIEEYRQFTE
ncbi:MAG: LacI family DNA-binding transcriptional regulator [Paludibacter sp.]|nr:LacI family DNA-binding transcriptional regulator [Paludibacter sp.]MDD4198559.1 LacI family DNA-binding transcriptional regulator [Paludibacter sp.]MDD4428437.1 LacI family DNA-binding transcriptional regulator [Paludibacter sp.]